MYSTEQTMLRFISADALTTLSQESGSVLYSQYLATDHIHRMLAGKYKVPLEYDFGVPPPEVLEFPEITNVHAKLTIYFLYARQVQNRSVQQPSLGVYRQFYDDAQERLEAMKILPVLDGYTKGDIWVDKPERDYSRWTWL